MTLIKDGLDSITFIIRPVFLENTATGALRDGIGCHPGPSVATIRPAMFPFRTNKKTRRWYGSDVLSRKSFVPPAVLVQCGRLVMGFTFASHGYFPPVVNQADRVRVPRQHFLNLCPDPHGHGSLRPILT
jgi:hypothetical protein